VELSERARLVAEARAGQDVELADGFTVPNRALARLAGEVPGTDLRDLVGELRRGSPTDRQLAARLLKEGDLTPEDRLAETRAALAVETDPLVVRWLVGALGATRSRAALPDLRRLAADTRAEVRFPVPDALSACTDTFGDVADTLLALARDGDEDVRWSAVYELAAWWPDTGGATIRARLAEVAAADPVADIRSLAADALSPPP
jgi:hypothetical protein